MRGFKKIKLIIALVSLLICFNFIQETYAKYTKSVDGTAGISVARWRILVNNENIRTGSLAASTITPVFAGDTHTASNVIAPTSTGYFDIVIDSTGTDVSFTYNISVSPSASSNVTDIVTTGYSVDGGTTVNFSTYNTDISDTVLYGSTSSRTIRIFVMWNDSTGSTMNNAADTNATYNQNANANLDVTLTFTQVTNQSQNQGS